MTNKLKRHVYRLCILSAASFLAAFLLYDLGDVGIATDQLTFPCTVLWMVGILIGFKAVDTWSSWDQDSSEHRGVLQNGSNAYPITFYSEAALVTLSVVFMLVFTINRNQPTIAEGMVLGFALFVAGACAGMGHLSSSLE